MATPTPAVGTRQDASPFKLPDVPKEFGQDNGEFYSRYDALAEKLDNSMINKLKQQLDTHLIFAGLFAGINSTFLAFTLPLLSANPADDTNALLRENNAILLQLAMNRNDSFPVSNALPSETFSASSRILTVNILFSISLMVAVMTSLFAVVGLQCLAAYRDHRGSGTDDHRWERLNRHLGARRWLLEWILGDLIPTILQIGLTLFVISLTIYLSTVHPILMKTLGTLLGIAIGSLVFTAMFALWDPFCPIQTPLSRLITWLARAAFKAAIILTGLVLPTAWSLIAPLLVLVVFPVFWLGLTIYSRVRGRRGSLNLPWRALFHAFGGYLPFEQIFRRPSRGVPQRGQLSPKGVTPTQLEVEAVRRVICNSNDSAALITSVTNILAIQNHQSLRRLAASRHFCNTLLRLCRTAYLEVLRLQGQNQTELAIAVTWRYRAAITHIGLRGALSPNFIFPLGIQASVDIDDEPGVSIPSGLIKASTPALIDGYLAYIAIIAWSDVQRFGPSLGRTFETEFERMIDSTWKRISIMVMCIRVTCRLDNIMPRDLVAAFSA
ncbi:hypothetical protein FRC04_007521 [Tulasnella sp. 424]|nr:hypothetical protein FRC04_007521 [Tulasnella sp. 424]